MTNLKIQIPDRFNVAQALIDTPIERGYGDKVAIYYQDKRITYKELLRLVNKTGNALRGLGVGMEDRILLLLLDSPEFAASFLGAMKIGAVPIPTNTLLTPNDYKYMLNDSRAETLIIHQDILPAIQKIKDQTPKLRNIIVVGQPQGEKEISFHKLTGEASDRLEVEPTSKDDVAFWLYSSGSTGDPKGVIHLHHDIIYTTDTYFKEVLGVNEKDLCFSVSKLFFAYGLGNGLTSPLRFGASILLYPQRPTPDKAFELITQYKPTLFFSVPTAYAAMLQIKDAESKYDLSSLRLCVSAGEALPAALFNEWKRRFGVEILDGIGTTEILHIFLSNRAGKVKPGTSGFVVPGYEAKIVDEEGREVEGGREGFLMVKGDSTAPFYWNKHEKTKKTMVGEWMMTGDVYARDDDGCFTYKGRSDDMLKAGGICVSPVEVENTLMEHPSVLEAAVVGAPDEQNLIKPKAFIVLKSSEKPSPEKARELIDFVKSRIAHYKSPRWIEFLPELPKTATGKIKRFMLRTP